MPLLNDWLYFNSEAGNRLQKTHFDALTRPFILWGPWQPPDTPGPLLGKLWSQPRAAEAIPGAAGLGRSLRAVPAFRSLGSPPQGAAHWTQGPTPGGAGIRVSAARAPGPKAHAERHRRFGVAPFTPPSLTPPEIGVSVDRTPGYPGVSLLRGAGSPQPPLPSRHAPPRRPSLPTPPASRLPAHPSRPSRPLPRRSRAAGPSTRCRRPRRRRRESPGRTRSPRRAESGGAAAGAARTAERTPGLGFLLGQTPPNPADPTPCSFLLGGAHLGTRSEVGGRRRVRAVSRVGAGSAEAARGAVVSEPCSPR